MHLAGRGEQAIRLSLDQHDDLVSNEWVPAGIEEGLVQRSKQVASEEHLQRGGHLGSRSLVMNSIL